ncbi:hypothetical protein Q8F55_003463 [Vanrija albida]|uniref:Ubiquitin-like domain-containing protein n=1 Tax=Vanrija albida TaxID=181172 RepID=A0ABR3Q418_9TREE
MPKKKKQPSKPGTHPYSAPAKPAAAQPAAEPNRSWAAHHRTHAALPARAPTLRPAPNVRPTTPRPAPLRGLLPLPAPTHPPRRGVDFTRLSYGAREPRTPHELVIKLQSVRAGNIYHDRIRVELHETAWHVKKYLARYCGYEIGAVRLVFDGVALADAVSFAALGAEEGDVFDVYLEGA